MKLTHRINVYYKSKNICINNAKAKARIILLHKIYVFNISINERLEFS